MKSLSMASLWTGLAASIISAQALAGVHIHHNVFVGDQNNWHAALQVINEQDHAWFVGPDDQTRINSFDVCPCAPERFGFAFDTPPTDFDVAYTVTLTTQNDKNPNFTSKTCVFLVTAKGPAQPDITKISYNGAVCDWKAVPGGEDFTVS